MKKSKLLTIMAIMSCAFCALCACEKQDTETAGGTTAGTEQPVASESSTTSATAAESVTMSTASIEISTENNIQAQIKEASYTELRGMLDEINTDITPETDGSEPASIKAAAHLLNWGVGTSLRTDEIEKLTKEWLSGMGDSERAEFFGKLAAVYDSYLKLLGPDAKELLDAAGCEDAAYPWSDSPLETVEAISKAAGLWADTVELVNLRGDKTTIYLLADGRYMNRSEEVFIYDGIDTWTDESGVEWNESVE